MAEANKYINQYRIESTRLKGYDYGSNGGYFVTIETHQMNHYLGEVVQTCHGTSPVPIENGESKEDHITPITNIHVAEETHHGASILLSPIGQVVHENWLNIPKHFPFVRLDKFVIMPNHIHGILFFNKPSKQNWESNKFKSTKGTLGMVMNLYKGSVKSYAKNNNIEFSWHPRYYDSIIRSDRDLNNIRNYIRNNPINWIKKESKK